MRQPPLASSTQRVLRRVLLGALVLAGVLPAVTWSQSGPYPHKPITLVVPSTAGGAMDNIARGVAEELSKQLGQPIIVENVGGASGTLGAQKVLRSPADGYTLMLGTMTEIVLAPTVLKTAGYAASDFTPIGKLAVTPAVLVTARVAVNTVDELVALAKTKPQGLSIGTSGSASFQTYSALSFEQAAGIQLLNVPYKGGGPLMNDTLAGQVDLAAIALPAALPHIRSGKLKALGVLSAERVATAPELPSANESRAVKGLDATMWAALVGPHNLPAPVLQRLNTAINDMLSNKEFRAARFKIGDLMVDKTDPASLAQLLANEEQRARAMASKMKDD